MDEGLLDPRTVRMPDFAYGEWINTERPLTKEILRGRVLLVDFWDYTCIHCIRSLPYLRNWHERYMNKGLTVIGVHAPEFRFARSRGQIEEAVSDLSIRYPVFLDNEYQTWERFANCAWPSKYLIDADGYIRYKVEGEEYFQEMERAIQVALRLRDPGVVLPEVMDPLHKEHETGAVCYRPTPELYAGYGRGALGNLSGYAADNPVVYEIPLPSVRQEGHFYAGGIWRSDRECFAFAGQDGGRIILPYRAVSVNAVLSPSSDLVEVILRLRPGGALPIIELQQDEQPLATANAGADIRYNDAGRSYISVRSPRMYELVRHPDFESRELELIFRATGLALYAFTFTTCVKPED